MSLKPAYVLELDGATPSNNVIKQMHFHAYKKLRREWRQKVLDALLEHYGRLPKTALELSRVEVDRHCVGYLDWDNALGGLKPLFDVLVQATQRNPDGLGLVVDDNPNAMPVAPVMRQFKAPRGKSKTVIRIYPVEAAQA